MKHLKYFLLWACVLGLLCSLTGCKNEQRFQTSFPLKEEELTEAMEKVGLEGMISESESELSLQTKGRTQYVHYVVRRGAEPQYDPENGPWVTGIMSAQHKGKRMLYTTFSQRVPSAQLAWEDWKPQLVLAALLYGGFENEEELYQALLGQELPEGKTSAAPDAQPPGGYDTVFTSDAQLPGGYCTVSCHILSHTAYDENHFEVTLYTATLRVNIYESCELYQELKEN